MRKKILLLNPPYPQPIIRDNYCCFTSKSGYQWAPTDLLYISGILNGNKSFRVTVIDAPAERLTPKATAQMMESTDYNIICCLTGTVSFELDMAFLKEYKNTHPQTKIFVTGNTPTFAPQRFLTQFPFVNGVLHNFMDKTIIQAFNGKPNMCKTCSYRNRKGISVGRINFTSQTIVTGIKPPLYGLFPIQRYSSPIIKSKPFITAMTAFGCPFTCSFCIASRLNYHTRDLKELEREFMAMKKSEIREISFLDSTFNANPPYVTSVLKMMIKKKFGFSWSAQIHSFRVTTDLIQLMKKAGCHTVQIGVESGSSEILKEYAPSKVKEKITAAVETCKKQGMRVLGYFIIGFPHESKKQVLETISYAKKLDPEFASFSTMTPDYGTKIYEDALKANSFKDRETEPLSAFDSSGKAILHNAYLSPQEQDDFTRKAYIDFYLNPKKMFSFLRDFPRIGLYIKNGLFLLSKKLFSFPLWSAYFSFKEQLVLFGLVLLGLATRTINAIYTPLWRDEISIFFVAKDNSLWKLLTQQHWDTAHPPLHSIFLHFWQMISIQPFWLRLPSLVASFFILYLLPILAVKITQKYKQLPFIFLFLFSLSHTQISLTMVVRPYPFAILFIVISLIFFLTLLEGNQKNNKVLFFFCFANLLAISTDYSTIWLFLTYFVFFCMYYVKYKNTHQVIYIFKALLFSAICSLSVFPFLFGNLKHSLRLEKDLPPIKSNNKTIKPGSTLHIVIKRKNGKIYIYDGRFNLIDHASLSSDPFPENKIYFGYDIPPLSLLNVNDVSTCQFSNKEQNINKVNASCRFQNTITPLKGNIFHDIPELFYEFSRGKKRTLLSVRVKTWKTALYKKPILIGRDNDVLLRVNLSSQYIFDRPGINIYGRLPKDPIIWWENINRFTIYPTQGSYRIIYYDGSSPNKLDIFGEISLLNRLSGSLTFFSGFPSFVEPTYIGLVSIFIFLCFIQIILVYLYIYQRRESFLLFHLLFIVPISLSFTISYFFFPIFLGRNLHVSNISSLVGTALLVSALITGTSIYRKTAGGVILILFLMLFMIRFPYLHYGDPAFDARSVAYFIKKDSNRRIYVIFDNENYYPILIEYNLLSIHEKRKVRFIQLKGLSKIIDEKLLLNTKMVKNGSISIYFMKFASEQKVYGNEFKKISQLLNCRLKQRQIDYIYFAQCE